MKIRAIICDLDGTLALLNGRNPYDASTCDQDLVNKPVLTIVKAMADLGVVIILCSGRFEKFRSQTESFLKKYYTPYDELFMRPDGDIKKDATLKKEIYCKQIKDKYEIHFVLDDRNRVVKMWRELGLTCLQVAEGDF